MPSRWPTLLGCFLFASICAEAMADSPAKSTPKDALRSFNDLIGPWRATGTPEGTARDKQKGFWQETQQWEWQFKGDDAWLKLTIDKGKYFSQGELRYLPDKDHYQLSLTTVGKEPWVFTGDLREHVLTVERQDEKSQETQRLVLSFIHFNRYLYRLEVRPAGKTLFTKLYQVGAIREDVAYAGPGDASPECIVSGGLGTIKVTYKGQIYHVCCSGCRDAFKDDPEKYIKEYEEKKKAKAK